MLLELDHKHLNLEFQISRLGMPIPRRFSFLGDSGNRGLHIFIPQGSRDLEPIPRGPQGIFGKLYSLK